MIVPLTLLRSWRADLARRRNRQHARDILRRTFERSGCSVERLADGRFDELLSDAVEARFREAYAATIQRHAGDPDYGIPDYYNLGTLAMAAALSPGEVIRDLHTYMRQLDAEQRHAGRIVAMQRRPEV